MKRFLIASALVFAPVALVAASPGAQGPAYIGSVSALVGGRQVPLESQEAQIKGHFGLSSMLGRFMEVKYNGPRSPVRMRGGDHVVLIARIASEDVDPDTLFSMRRLDAKKDARIDLGKGSMRISIMVQPYGRNLVKIVPNAPLAPGEYVVASTPSIQSPTTRAHLFGVD